MILFDSNMTMNTRQTAILDLLRNEQRLSVRELAKRFTVTEMTIRRDLDALEAQGFLVRTHGGGMPTGKLRFAHSAFPQFDTSPMQRAIGQAAAKLVQPGQTIMVDTGTTALEVARHLPQDANITVATTSLCVAQALYGSPLNVLIFGGFLRKEFPSLYGPLTEKMLEGFHVDILFMGCDGADAEGFYTGDLHISQLEQAMIRIADRTIVVTESQKFGHRAFVRYAVPTDIHTLVTDNGLPEQDRLALEEQGLHVVAVTAE